MLKLMASALLLALQAVASVAFASADYPSKPVRIVVPYAAGGPADILARMVGQKLSEQFGQQFIIDNRPGAGGSIGAGQVARTSAADGYTLLVAPIGVVAINPWINSNLPYDALRDFEPITVIAKSPFLLAVNPNVPAKTLSEFVAYAKKAPGQVKIANAGIGTGQHLAAVNFSSVAGIETVNVPYRGSAPGTNDLLGGTVEAQFDLAPLLPHVAAGKLRPIAVTSAKRMPSLPNVPTVAESGFPGFEMVAWNSLVAPAGTPRSIVDKLQGAIKQALESPDVKEKMESQGYIIGGESPDETKAFFKSEFDKYGPVVKSAGVVTN